MKNVYLKEVLALIWVGFDGFLARSPIGGAALALVAVRILESLYKTEDLVDVAADLNPKRWKSHPLRWKIG